MLEILVTNNCIVKQSIIQEEFNAVRNMSGTLYPSIFTGKAWTEFPSSKIWIRMNLPAPEWANIVLRIKSGNKLVLLLKKQNKSDGAKKILFHGEWIAEVN